MSAKSRAPKKSARPARKKAARKAAAKVDPLNRKGYTSISPLLAVRDMRRAVDFYVKALGFKLRGLMDGPQGPVHAELRLRDTTLMLSPEDPAQHSFGAKTIGNTPVTLYILVENVDDVFKRAVSAGASTAMPVTNQFWGDRAGMIIDPEGNKWMIATHKADPTPAEMAEAMQRMMAQAPAAESARAAAAGSESEY